MEITKYKACLSTLATFNAQFQNDLSFKGSVMQCKESTIHYVHYNNQQTESWYESRYYQCHVENLLHAMRTMTIKRLSPIFIKLNTGKLNSNYMHKAPECVLQTE